MIVTVRGVSQKGKNRIKEHGPDWLVIGVVTEVWCLDKEPGLLLRCMCDHEYDRWMKINHDAHFEIREVR